MSDKNDIQTAAKVNHNAAKRKTLKFLSYANSAIEKDSLSISSCNTFQLNGILLQFLKRLSTESDQILRKSIEMQTVYSKNDLNKNNLKLLYEVVNVFTERATFPVAGYS